MALKTWHQLWQCVCLFSHTRCCYCRAEVSLSALLMLLSVSSHTRGQEGGSLSQDCCCLPGFYSGWKLHSFRHAP